MTIFAPPRHLVWGTDRLDLADPFQRKMIRGKAATRGASYCGQVAEGHQEDQPEGEEQSHLRLTATPRYRLILLRDFHCRQLTDQPQQLFRRAVDPGPPQPPIARHRAYEAFLLRQVREVLSQSLALAWEGRDRPPEKGEQLLLVLAQGLDKAL